MKTFKQGEIVEAPGIILTNKPPSRLSWLLGWIFHPIRSYHNRKYAYLEVSGEECTHKELVDKINNACAWNGSDPTFRQSNR